MKKLIFFSLVCVLIGMTLPGFAADPAHTFLSVKQDKIVDGDAREVKLRGFHYDAFYALNKQIYFALNDKSTDKYNTGLAKYFFSENDIDNFKALGANVVRIGLRLWQIEKQPYLYSEESLRHLDDTIAKFGKNGIYVILDLHAAGQNYLSHNNEYGYVLWNNITFQNRVVALWGALASRYKNNPYIAGYDLINEPQAPSKIALHNLYQRIIDRIRKYDNHHILFIEVDEHREEELLIGGKYNDENIVVSIHFYKPGKFTNQGLGGKPAGYKYPGVYNNVYWDKNKIDRHFSKFLEFDELKGRPVFVGEFSANVMDGKEDALGWIGDVIDVLNSKGIHYTFFSYKDNFTPSFGYYQPDRQTGQKINVLMRRLKNKQASLADLTSEQKEILLTENFRSSSALRQILEEGFKK